jgi:Glycosyl transferase family 21
VADRARLAVVIPATNDPPHLDACLAAIERSTERPDELVVVREPPHRGPAAARNAGAAQTASEILVFVDADVLVHADALARIRRRFERDPGLVAVFGSYDASPAAEGVVSQFRNLLHHYVHQEGAGPATTFWAGLGAMRRTAFEAVGGFDAERYPRPSIEDVELGARLHARGERLELDPEILGRHLKSWSLGAMLRTDVLDRGVPWGVLLLRREASPAGLNLGARHRATAVAAVVLAGAALARRKPLAAAAAAAILVLNRRFYRTVAAEADARTTAATPFLHVLHHLASVVSIGLAAAAHVRALLRRR